MAPGNSRQPPGIIVGNRQELGPNLVYRRFYCAFRNRKLLGSTQNLTQQAEQVAQVAARILNQPIQRRTLSNNRFAKRINSVLFLVPR